MAAEFCFPHTDTRVDVFLSKFIAPAIPMLTVSIQTIKAATANPVKSL